MPRSAAFIGVSSTLTNTHVAAQVDHAGRPAAFSRRPSRETQLNSPKSNITMTAAPGGWIDLPANTVNIPTAIK